MLSSYAEKFGSLTIEGLDALSDPYLTTSEFEALPYATQFYVRSAWTYDSVYCRYYRPTPAAPKQPPRARPHVADDYASINRDHQQLRADTERRVRGQPPAD
jgi:hypothetical protein